MSWRDAARRADGSAGGSGVSKVCRGDALKRQPKSDAAIHQAAEELRHSQFAGVEFDHVRDSGCVTRGGTFASTNPSPSAIVKCAMTASRRTVYGSPASIAVCTAAMTSPASEPIIVK